jgi:hypothetical protein
MVAKRPEAYYSVAFNNEVPSLTWIHWTNQKNIDAGKDASFLSFLASAIHLWQVKEFPNTFITSQFKLVVTATHEKVFYEWELGSKQYLTLKHLA